MCSSLSVTESSHWFSYSCHRHNCLVWFAAITVWRTDSDSAKFLGNGAMPLPWKVKNLAHWLCCRSIPWKVLLLWHTDATLPCIATSCTIISCNWITPIFPACIIAVSIICVMGSHQDWDLTQARPNLFLKSLNAAEAKQTMSGKAMKRCSSTAWLTYSFQLSMGNPLNSVTWLPHLSQVLHFTALPVWEKWCKTAKWERGLGVLNVGIVLLKPSCI